MDWAPLRPGALPPVTALSTSSINHFKMSAAPPNQSQLGLVTGLWSLPFSKKRKHGERTHEEAGETRNEVTKKTGPERKAMWVCVYKRTEASPPNRDRGFSPKTCCYVAVARPCFVHWAWAAGAMGLILGTIGVGFHQRGVLRKNICKGSRQRRGWRRRREEEEEEEGGGGRTLAWRCNNADLSSNRARHAYQSLTGERGNVLSRSRSGLCVDVFGPFLSHVSRTRLWENCVYAMGRSEHDVITKEASLYFLSPLGARWLCK